MASAKNVAEYFLMLSRPDIGDTMSNLRLQKLVYYAQGFHLAKFGQPLFDEPIVAWSYGPVVESLYNEYRNHGAGVIPQPESPDFSMFTEDQKELMDDVFDVYGQYSALRLMELTHSELPWKTTKRNGIIRRELMRNYFRTRLK